jgi:hypothetical protein
MNQRNAQATAAVVVLASMLVMLSFVVPAQSYAASYGDKAAAKPVGTSPVAPNTLRGSISNVQLDEKRRACLDPVWVLDIEDERNWLGSHGIQDGTQLQCQIRDGRAGRNLDAQALHQ